MSKDEKKRIMIYNQILEIQTHTKLKYAGFKLYDAEDACRPDFWGRMFDYKIFDVKDV